MYLVEKILFKLNMDKVSIVISFDIFQDKNIVIKSFILHHQIYSEELPIQILYQNYTVKMVLKCKHLEYPCQITMEPSRNYLSIDATINIVKIKNPHTHSSGFQVLCKITPRNKDTIYFKVGTLSVI